MKAREDKRLKRKTNAALDTIVQQIPSAKGPSMYYVITEGGGGVGV